MADTPIHTHEAQSDVRVRLREIAKALRESSSIDAGSCRPLADLVDELTTALSSTEVPPAEVARLADCTAQLVESLHPSQAPGLLHTARERLEAAVTQAEVYVPTAAGLARQALETLANMGI